MRKLAFLAFIQVARKEGLRTAIKRSLSYVRNRVIYRTFALWEKLGIHVTPVHFYEPIPDRRELRRRNGLWDQESELVGIDLNVDEQLYYARHIFPLFNHEQESTVPSDFVVANVGLGSVDREVVHCMVRHFSPKRIIECGSGYSTHLLARAALLNKKTSGGETQFCVIDPYPSAAVAAGLPGLSTLRRERVEDIEPAFFQQLEAGDILFIDTSHVVKTGGDVNHLFLEVLPRLNPSVVVHIHDIFLPRDYPKEWVISLKHSWNEQYLLQAFLSFNHEYKIIWASNYIFRHYPGELSAVAGDYGVWPCSIWLQRCSK